MRLIESHHALLSPARSDHQILVLSPVPSMSHISLSVVPASSLLPSSSTYATVVKQTLVRCAVLINPQRLIFSSSSGQVKLRMFLSLYLLTLPLQLLTTGSLLEQGSTALAVFTAIHAGIIAGLSWALLANAIIETKVIEDGTLRGLVVCPSLLFNFALIAHYSPTTYSQSYSLP